MQVLGDDAGFEEHLKSLDFGMRTAAARMAAEVGVSHFARVSTWGASANAAKSMPGIPAVYFEQHGKADDALLAMASKFALSVSVYRPGPLGRGHEFAAVRPNEANR